MRVTYDFEQILVLPALDFSLTLTIVNHLERLLVCYLFV